MRKKKLLTAVISLALVILVALPGTLAVSNGQDSSDTPAETTAPVAEAEKTCTCDPAPAEGEAHAEGCPLYVTALAETKKTCTCGVAEGEAHKEDCPLYAAPEKAVEEAKTCTCDPAPAEGEAHKEGCPLHAAPEKAVEEAKTCICDPAPAEGEAHKQGCPLYAAPEKAAEEAKTCTCGVAEGEAHKEDCPLYVAPEQPAEEAKTCTCGVAEGEAHKADCPLFQHLETCGENCTGEDCECPCHLFDKLMACKTMEEMETFIAETDKEVLMLLSDAQVAKVEAYMESLMPAPLPPIVIEESDPPVESEIYTPTVNYTNVAPFVGPVSGGNN